MLKVEKKNYVSLVLGVPGRVLERKHLAGGKQNQPKLQLKVGEAGEVKLVCRRSLSVGRHTLVSKCPGDSSTHTHKHRLKELALKMFSASLITPQVPGL